MTSEEYMKRMTEISSRKLVLLSEISDLTFRQSEVISEDSIAELEKLVAEKQIKIDAITKLDEDFDVYFQRMKSMLKVKSLEELKDSDIKEVGELKEIIAKIVELIGRISTIEKQNNENAGKVLKSIGDEIKKFNQGKKINKAYIPAPSKSPSYFIDKKK
jgi:acetylglutamate kinase